MLAGLQESESFSVRLGPVCCPENALEGFAGQGIAAVVVVYDHDAAVLVAVDAAAGPGLALQGEAVLLEGCNKLANRGIAQAVDQGRELAHAAVIATTGS